MLDCRASDMEVKGHAIWSAGRVRDLLARISHAPTSTDQLTSRLDAIAQACQARPVDSGATLAGRINRMVDPAWWARNVRRELLRENEAIEHASAAIHKARQCYVTDHAVKSKAARRKANAEVLEALECVNEDGEVINLGEVARGSVSNPAIRRAELMMRCRGFEEVATALGHVARFFTITAPSRFHRFTGPIDHQQENPKWDGSTPKDAQGYLSKVWAKIRAAWRRMGFFPYGFRVAEPHHDGCPHWHILLWMPSHQAGWFSPMRAVAGRNDSGAGVVGTMGRYAMQDSAGEIGWRNRTARFDCKVIKAGAGTATGYIAKYIAKNVDGMREDGGDIGFDLEADTPATQGANRVRDWASTWGIRQFQQIGGPSVTVWRELRRMREESTGPVQMAFDFEGPRSAADQSKWAQFWILQGGPWTPRKDLTLRPFRMEVEGGKYGDAIQKTMGVESITGVLYRTRMHEWTIQRAGLAACNAADREARTWVQVVKINHEIEASLGLPLSEGVRFPVLPEFGAKRPRTRVNNCTHVKRFNIRKSGPFWTWEPIEGPGIVLQESPPGKEIEKCEFGNPS